MNIQSIKDIMWNNLSVYNVEEVDDICDAIIDLVQSNTTECKSITVKWVKEEEACFDTPMVVSESNHPRYKVGSRFYYGYMGIAAKEGYTITLLPQEKIHE